MEHRTVSVAAARLPRWIDGFAERHGGSSQRVTDGVLQLEGANGATAGITPPYPVSVMDAPDFAAAVRHVPRTGVILVRRGGFAAAIVEGDAVMASAVGKGDASEVLNRGSGHLVGLLGCLRSLEIYRAPRGRPLGLGPGPQVSPTPTTRGGAIVGRCGTESLGIGGLLP